MARFVILRHEGTEAYKPGVHWDLMLECDGVLKTWALAREPSAGIAIVANELPDHRLAYLDYEGPVSGDRGAVTRWDAGEHDWIRQSTAELEIQLEGGRLRGRVRLLRTDATSWWFTFESSPT